MPLRRWKPRPPCRRKWKIEARLDRADLLCSPFRSPSPVQIMIMLRPMADALATWMQRAKTAVPVRRPAGPKYTSLAEPFHGSEIGRFCLGLRKQVLVEEIAVVL